jgi:hypothetical protein
MAEVLFVNVPQVTAGLTSGTDTLTYTIPSGAGMIYTASVDVTNPPATGLSIVVQQNGTPVFTAAVEGQTQTAQKFRYSQLYTAADVISVVLSSSTASDKVMQAVKAIVTVRQGL